MVTVAPEVPTARKLAGLKRSKKFKAFRGAPLNLTEEQALTVILGEAVGALLFAPKPEAQPAPQADDLAAQLVANGSTAEDAVKAAISRKTPLESAEALAAQHHLTFTDGRAFLSTAAIEAAVRVRKTGSPEIVSSAGTDDIKAVLLYRDDSGDLVAQNLAESAA